MPYTINKFNGTELVVLEDGTIDTSTSLGLVGRNYVGYGETHNENFVFLLENFSNDSAPSRPLKGQTWFDSTLNLLNVFDGTQWTVVGAAQLSATPPTSTNAGSLWLKTPYNTLYSYDGTEWVLIGPETAEGFGVTKAESTVLTDTNGDDQPVILLKVDGNVIAIISSTAFAIGLSTPVIGFTNLIAGLTLSNTRSISGNLEGLATRATRLNSARRINNIAFDGQTDITITASTPNSLIKGDYLTGSNFNGSSQVTLGVDATSANTIGKVVARNSTGGFSAGTINATFIGDITGNVTATSGTSTFDVIRANQVIGPTLSGNADSATKLYQARKINNVDFDGTNDITVTAEASTLTGTIINSTVLDSSLRTVGTLTNLSVADTGVTIGAGSEFRAYVSSSTSIVSGTGQVKLSLRSDTAAVNLMSSSIATSLGSVNDAPALAPDTNNTLELGLSVKKWLNVHATNFKGNADSATLASKSTNVAGGAAGSIPYQTASNTTSFLPIGSPAKVLKVNGSNLPEWADLGLGTMFVGSYLTGSNYSGGADTTWAVDATSANTASKVVARDSSGNFSAGTITATISGNVTGDVTGIVTGSASLNVLKTGDTMTGNLSITKDNAWLTLDSPSTSTEGEYQAAGISLGESGQKGSASLHFTYTGDGYGHIGMGPVTQSTSLPQYEAIRLYYLDNTVRIMGSATIGSTPTDYWHVTNKGYVDSRIPQYTIISGAQYTYGYTNSVGSWNNSSNYFDVFPPSGKTMGNLVAFMPSIHAIYFAGGVNGDDAMRCSYSYLADRIRVYVQNTEQRYYPAANYIVIWS